MNILKNIYIEGIQGMGKSTLLQNIAIKNPGFKVCREGDYSPVELAWCAWMSESEYKDLLDKYPSIQSEIIKNTVKEGEAYIVTYTKIITDILGFHKYLENYEIYNATVSLEEFKKIIIARYSKFRDEDYLFECSFLQNIVEDLILFHQLSDEEIIEFYKKLYEVIDKNKFLLLYLYSENIEENIRHIKAERSDDEGNELWYKMMINYLVDSPYGKMRGFKNFNDLIAHLRHRQYLEMRIIDEVIGENAIILPAKEYTQEDIERILAGVYVWN